MLARAGLALPTAGLCDGNSLNALRISLNICRHIKKATTYICHSTFILYKGNAFLTDTPQIMSDPAIDMKRSLSPNEIGSSMLLQKERNTQLESLSDLGYDDKELDKTLFERLEKRSPSIKSLSASSDRLDRLLVLYNIISNSPALDQSFRDMDKLENFFADHEMRLTSLLINGWNSRSFTEIRKLSMFFSLSVILYFTSRFLCRGITASYKTSAILSKGS